MKKTVQKKNTKGFTLVELIVTLVLMGMLLGIGGAALSAYVRYAKFRYQNETAQSLFLAAQTRLTQYRADGENTALAMVCEDTTGGAIPLNKQGQMLYQLTDENGKTVEASAIWQKKGTDAYGSLYALCATAEDYARYQGGDETLSASATALYDILDAYLYDKSVLKTGAVCLELDPYEGTVYSVLYAQDAAGFTYTGEAGKVDVRDRTEETRRRNMVGYYGAQTQSQSLWASDAMPSIRTLLLTNGDTLELSWTLDKKSISAMAQLKYEIDLEDPDTGNTVLKLTIDPEDASLLGNSTFVAEDSASLGRMVEASVQRAAANEAGLAPEYVNLGTYTFPAYIDSSKMIHLTLDAVDTAATENKYALLAQDAHTFSTQRANYPMENCFSLHRFLLEELGTESIRCTVHTLESGRYMASAAKSSNTESLYFGALSGDEQARIYQVRNARHLNNIRYLQATEGTVPAQSVQFEVCADFAWNGENGIVQNGAVYDTSGADTAPNHASRDFEELVSAGYQSDGTYQDVDFPSISALSANETLQSAGSTKVYTISGLTISSKTDLAAAVPGAVPEAADSTDGAQATGLFLINRGTIQNLALAQVSVIGQNNVGAFCGKNAGNLQKLEVKSGSIYGISHVGGVFGGQYVTSETLDGRKDGIFVFSELINRAAVTGHTYVGGITGSLEAGRARVYGTENARGNGPVYGKYEQIGYTISKCENDGVVRGDWKALTENDNPQIGQLYRKYYTGGTREEPSYIGGIIGYGASNYDAEKNGKIAEMEVSCTLQNCISSPQGTAEEWNALLNDIAQDVAAGGSAEDILRGEYVGGIIGYADDIVLQNCITRKSSRANAYVVGGEYVGGIAGWSNSSLAQVQEKTTQADVLGRSCVGGVAGASAIGMEDAIPTVRGWKVTGTAAGTVGYVGGVCGWNEGILYGCSVRPETGEENEKIRDAVGKTADYVGGIAGLNVGSLQSCNTVQEKTAGRNCVGGVAGCQGTDGTISECSVEGGSVLGRDFVGGFTGLCLNAGVMSAAAQPDVTPSKVEGRYFVGGCFGACLVEDEQSRDYTVKIAFENPLGTVYADHAYAGTFAGLCAVVAKNGVNADGLALPEPHQTAADGLLQRLFALAGDDLLTDTSAVNELLSGCGGAARLVFSGSAGEKSTHVAGVNAGLYAAGVVGCIPDGTRALLTNLTNGSPVVTTHSVDSAELGIGDTNKYSYAGGILGRCGTAAAIVSCSNASDADIRVPSECILGALTEVNCGRIISCLAATFGRTDAAGVGGIAGVNLGSEVLSDPLTWEDKTYDTAGIYDCRAVNASISGQNQVGAIAAQNDGIIRNAEIRDTSVSAEGSYGGGIVGENGGTVAECTVYGLILTNRADTETGSALGGIAGINGSCGGLAAEGLISGCYVANAEISGSGDAGNLANVGGIVGINAGSGTVENVDFGTGSEQELTISDSQYFAYGETAAAGENVKRTGSVLVYAAQYGNAGGTAGLNDGVIRNVSKTTAENETDTVPGRRVSPQAKVLVSSNIGHCGGIVGCNFSAGSVSNAETGAGSYVWGQNDAENTAVGGIIGYNISNHDIAGCYNWATVIKSSGSSAGGVIGRCEITASEGAQLSECANYGSISGGSQAGGMIGSLKYCAMSIRDCVNYGRITCGENAGGILGMRDNSQNSAKLYLMNCANHGAVGVDGNSTNIGGIWGGAAGGVLQTGENSILNCANTGLIYGKADSSGGIAGACAADGSGLEMAYCVNYGYAGQGSGMVCGITPIRNSAVSVRHCVSVAGTENPISSAADTKFENCFYFTQDGTANGRGEPLVPDGQEWKSAGITVFRDLSAVPTDLDSAAGHNSDTGLTVTGSADNVRYLMYQTIQNELIEQLGAADTAEIEKIVFTEEGGGLKAAWNVTPGSVEPAYYTVTVSYDGAAGSAGTIYASDMMLAMSGHEGQTVTVTVCAGRDGTPWSESYQIGYTMPAPEIHFEMTEALPVVQYKIVLDNAQELQEFLNQHPNEAGVPASLADITLQLSSSPYGRFCTGSGASGEASIAAADAAYGTLRYEGDSSESRCIAARYVITDAAAAGRKINRISTQMAWESPAIDSSQLEDGAEALVDMQLQPEDGSTGFMGDENGLCYQVLTKTGRQAAFMRTELMVRDPQLGVDVSLSSSLSGGYANTAIYTQLNSLPDNLFSVYGDLYIRSYPESMANQTFVTGHTVKLDAFGEETDSLDSAQLAALRVTNDGEISLDQSEQSTDGLLIYPHAIDAEQYPETDSASETENYLSGLRRGYVIERTAEDTYTLYYNTLLNQDVDFSLAAESKEMSRQVQFFSIGSAQYLQTMPEVTISQNGAQVSVSWKAAENTQAEYKCSVYGADSPQTGNGADSLSETAISLPSSPVYDAAAGCYTVTFADTSGWSYSRIRARITHLAETDQSGNIVRFACTGTAEMNYLQVLPEPVVTAVTQATNEDDLIYSVAWNPNLNAACTEAPDHYLIKIAAAGMETKIISTADAGVAENATDTHASVNLDDYAGQMISVTVQAIAKSGSVLFTNSRESGAYSAEVAARLAKPEQSVLSMALTYHDAAVGAAQAIPAEEYDEMACTLTADGSMAGYPAGVQYELVLGISAASGNAPDAASMLNSGNAFYLDSRQNDLVTPELLNRGCAGKYLYVKIRACAAGYVSSAEAEYWFPLPKARLEMPACTEHTAVTANIPLTCNSVPQEITMTATQRAIAFGESECGRYGVQITEPDGITKRHIVLSRNAGGEWSVEQDGTAVSQTNGVWLLNDTFRQTAGWNSNTLEAYTAASIRLEENMPVLVLPDCISAALSDGTEISFSSAGSTQQVTICALPEDTNRWTESEPYVWPAE